MKKHFVTFLSPGTLFSETTTKPIASWSVEKAKAMVGGITERHGATPYGFMFTTRERGPKDLDSKVVKASGVYYLGGKVETLAQVKRRATSADKILISNMECNKIAKVITNTNSWKFTAELRKGDVVVEWP